MKEENNEMKALFATLLAELTKVNERLDELISLGKQAIKPYTQSKASFQTAEKPVKKSRTANANNEYDDTIRYYEDKIKLNPNDADAYYNLGEFYERYEKNYDKAIECYKKAIKLKPNNADYYFNLGLVYEANKKDYDKAIECYKKMIKLDPDDSDAYDSLVEIYEFYKKDYDKAIEYYKKMLKLFPSRFYLYHFLGKCYLKKGDRDKAIESFKKGARLRDRYSKLWLDDNNIPWEDNSGE